MDIEFARDWTFESSAVASAFDQHVREQLPWYDLATGAIAHVVRHYLPQNGVVYDIGASTGNVGRAIASILKQRDATIIPIEQSAEMAALYDGPGRNDIVVADATKFEYQPFDVAVAFLTMMFVPIDRRRPLVSTLRERCRPGGVIVVVDKVPSSGGYFGTVLSRLALAGKVAAGVPSDQIVAKEMSLAGIQRPFDLGVLSSSAIEWFRMGDFVGWVIEG